MGRAAEREDEAMLQSESSVARNKRLSKRPSGAQRIARRDLRSEGGQ